MKRYTTGRRVRIGLAAAATLVAMAAPASATEYVGYGDTGWSFYDKRECCEEAAYLAQDHGALMCENAGGRPKIRSGRVRASCEWDARGSGRDRTYRCTARTQVPCW